MTMYVSRGQLCYSFVCNRSYGLRANWVVMHPCML
jgi:hypothetical protein